MIPKVFHRIWFGAPPPPEFVEYGQSWLRHNPGWLLKEWDEEEVRKVHITNWELFENPPAHIPDNLVPRFRSDVFRYEILQRMGGLYLDHDFEALSPLEPHIENLGCFAVQEKPGLIANGFLGALPEHHLIEELVKGLHDHVMSNPGSQVWQLTGPGYLTKMAQEYGGLSVLPTDKFLPYHYTQLDRYGKHSIPTNAVAHHVWASIRQSVSVIIPWRGGDQHRERALEWVLKQYNRYPEWQIVLSEQGDSGPWCKADAVNRGVKKAYGDILVIADADLWSDGIEEAVALAQQGAKWVVPYHQLYRMNAAASEQVLAGNDPDDIMSDWSLLDEFAAPYPGVLGGGIVVIRRRTYEKCPMDTRFRGWGGEDIAWGCALRTIAGRPRRLQHPLYHIWHPPQERQSRNVGNAPNHELYQKYNRAMRVPARMKRLVGEAREAFNATH